MLHVRIVYNAVGYIQLRCNHHHHSVLISHICKSYGTTESVDSTSISRGGLIILYTTKDIFQTIFFLYSPCPKLDGIKMRSSTGSEGPRLVSAVCTNSGGHRDAFLNEWHKAPRSSRDLLSRPPSLERSKRQGLFFVIAWCKIRQSENVDIALVSLSSC